MRTNNGNILQDNFYIFSARCCVSPFTFLVLPFDTDLSVIKAGGGCGRKLAEPCLPHSAGTGDGLVTFVTLLHNCGGRIHNITGDQGQGQGTGDLQTVARMRFTELLNFHIDTFGKTLSWPFFRVEDYYGLIFVLCKKLSPPAIWMLLSTASGVLYSKEKL